MGVLAGIIFFLFCPGTHELYISATRAHPFIVGFLKFFILATMGELLTLRILANEWTKPAALSYRALIWGLIGMAITLMFDIFPTGVSAAMDRGLLPGKGSKLAFAFFTSTVANFAFAPTFMSFHRITDTYLDLKYGRHLVNTGLGQAVKTVDWESFVTFVVVKTLPGIWIPAHTITFLLPAEYRVLAAALLSILLGALLAFAKKRSTVMA